MLANPAVGREENADDGVTRFSQPTPLALSIDGSLAHADRSLLRPLS
jgi:hypothetical protein